MRFNEFDRNIGARKQCEQVEKNQTVVHLHAYYIRCLCGFNQKLTKYYESINLTGGKKIVTKELFYTMTTVCLVDNSEANMF